MDISQENLNRYCDNICKVRSKREAHDGQSPDSSTVSPEGPSRVVVVPVPTSPDDELSDSLKDGNQEQSTTE